MNKWILAKYIIDSKKVIDSIMFINDNYSLISNLYLKDIIEEKLRLFYIYLCVVFEKSFSRNKLKEIKNNDSIINKIYYERDKNYAHKDEDYEIDNYDKMIDLIKQLKKELEYTKNYCKDHLPEELSLDYVSYDRNLFRFAYGINPQIEKELNRELYSLTPNELISKKEYKVFNDIEAINNIKDKSEYVVLLENGLTLEEGIQNRQDASIKINVLNEGKMWFNVNYDENISKSLKADLLEIIAKIKQIH